MQNIKNFKIIKPSKKLLKTYAIDGGETPLFLQADDGQDWYTCQALFSDDTVKIQYDSDGVIRFVVDKPVPQRGNVYAVSMLWPDGMSVAEIAQADYPAGCCTDGTWKFDGVSIYQDSEVLASQISSGNQRLRKMHALTASLAIATIQAGMSQNRQQENDDSLLLQWQDYLCNLRAMTEEELQQSPAPFPLSPQLIF
ncbi:MAG: tail fiber assembly protein [Kluyvera sp.]|uniref:tail fiber assembly protein n=1 Tax=Kluyvera sp. TaxID=1538228 RepID=UPI003A8639C2